MRYFILKDHFNYDFISRMARWHVNHYLFNKSRPVSAGVYITEVCNARCIMCNIWKKKKPLVYPRKAQERSIDALSKAGCFFYSVSGGEPTTVRDLPDRLAYASRKIPYVRLTTNGTLMTAELARALGEAGVKEIGLSIDGTDEYHNMMRGIPDAAKKVWNALDLVLTNAPKVQVVVNSVLTPYNLEGLKEVGMRLKKFPKVRQKYLPVTFHEILDNQETNTLPVPLEKASIPEMERFIDDAIKNPNIINSNAFMKKAKLFINGDTHLFKEQKRCLYPYHAIEFDPDGNAFLCITGMNFKNGLPPENDLGRYLDSSECRGLRKKLEGCSKCQKSMILCYFEPRINFPIGNFLYYLLRY